MKHLVEKPRLTERVLSRTANPRHTAGLMEGMARRNAFQTARLARALDGQGRLERLWRWVRENIRYEEDPEGTETLRTPARTVWDGRGDCDCMGILIASVLINWGIPFAFKVVEVHRGEGWGHVYAVAYDGGREVPLDTVPQIRYFGHEHSHYKSFIHMAKTVELGRISAQYTDELKAALSRLYNQLAGEEVAPEDAATKEKELSILKIVISRLDDEDALDEVLAHAVRNSVVLQDVYVSISQGSSSGELGSIFSKIKDSLDKLGETGIGKVFRSLRDKALPIVDPLGIANKAGGAFNSLADATRGSSAAPAVQANATPAVQANAAPAAGAAVNAAVATQEKASKEAAATAADAAKADGSEEPWYKQTKWQIGLGIGGLLLLALLLWWAFKPKTLSGTRRRRRVAKAATRRRRTMAGLPKRKPAKKRKAAKANKKRRRKSAKK